MVTRDLLNDAGDLAATMTWAHTVATLVPRRGGDVAHAMQDRLHVGRLVHAVAIGSLAVAITACDVGFHWNLDAGVSSGCLAIPQPSANYTTATDSEGCTEYTCKAGFFGCGNSPNCAYDLLNDSHNCGDCGNECGAAGCHEGACGRVTVLAENLAVLGPLALDATSVYAVRSTWDGLLRIPKTGGAATLVAPLDGNVGANELALGSDASGVYWMSDSTLYVLRPSNATPVALAAGISFPQAPLRFDDAWVYLVVQRQPEGVDAGLFGLGVLRIPKAGGSPETLFPITVYDLYYFDAPLAVASSRLAFADGTNLLTGSNDGGARGGPDIAGARADGSRVARCRLHAPVLHRERRGRRTDRSVRVRRRHLRGP